jgi:hypothetical protein
MGDPDGVSLDLLVAEIAQLKERVASLERAAFGAGSEYVETWSRAAALLGIDEKTAKRRHAAGEFPDPCRLTRVTRGAAGGGSYDVPTWRRADLVAYAEGR